MEDGETIYWLRKMIDWCSRLDGAPLVFFRGEKMAKLDELCERGFCKKYSCWADITPAGRRWAEGDARVRLLMEYPPEEVAPEG